MSRSIRSTAAAIVIAPTPSETGRKMLDMAILPDRGYFVAMALCDVGTRQDAEDVVQGVCLAVLEGEVRLTDDRDVAWAEFLGAVMDAVRRHAGGRERW